MVRYGFDNGGFLTYVRASQNSLKSLNKRSTTLTKLKATAEHKSIDIYPTPSLWPWVQELGTRNGIQLIIHHSPHHMVIVHP